MCGIIGYFGKSAISIRRILDIALWNVYRGDDGIGIIYPNDEIKSGIKMWKLPFKMEEISTKTLDKSRAVKFTKVGSIGMNKFDKKTYSELNKEFKKLCNNILNSKQENLFLHHRGASYGSASKQNLHPIVIGDNYFIHNGTSYSASFLKSYMETFDDLKFKTETDTELLGMIYLKLLDKKYSGNNILDTLHRIFGMFGVLIRINRNLNKFGIIKDSSRHLWLAELKDGGYILISEPTPHLQKKLKNLWYLGDGIIKPDSDIAVKNYTKSFNQAIKIWSDDLDNKSISTKKCDVCGAVKPVRRFCTMDEYFDNTYHDRCFECTILKDKRTTSTYNITRDGDDVEWELMKFPELSFD